MKQARRYFKNTSLTLLLVCLFALFFRLWLFSVLQPWDEAAITNKVLIGDSAGYQATAVSIINNRTLLEVGAWWTPGYFFFLAFIYFIFGVKPWLVLLAQVLLDTGTVIIVYFIARKLFESETVPLIAAFLYSISFPSAFYSIRLLSETPFTFALALAVLAFITGLKENRPGAFALSGLLTGIAVYIRVVAVYLPAVLIFVLLFAGNGVIHKLRNISILLIVFFLTLSPWQLRNLKSYGQYALTTNGGANLITNAAIAKASVDNISQWEAQKELEKIASQYAPGSFEESKMWQKAALAYIAEHPLAFMKCQVRGIAKMFLGTGQSGLTYLFGIKTEPSYSTESLYAAVSKTSSNIRNELPNILLFTKQLIEYFFIVIGFAAMYKKDKKLYLLLFVTIILYFAVITGPIGYSRFRVPIIPFYLVISAAGMFEAFKFIGRKYS